MKKYDLHSIMRAAWKFFRKGVSSFSLALRLAWANAHAGELTMLLFGYHLATDTFPLQPPGDMHSHYESVPGHPH